MPMTPAQPSVLSSRGSTFLSGEPSILSDVEDYIDTFDVTLGEAVEELLLPLQNQIRAEARQDPDWAEFADFIEVDFWDNQFQFFVNATDDVVQAAMDLEYGTEDRPPKSLLRKHALRNSHPIGTKLTEMMRFG